MTVEGHHALSRVNPPEGKAFYYCPTCGIVATAPALRWCTHSAGRTTDWRAHPDWTPMRPAVVYAEPER
jgi:hypothetical protein